MHHIETINQTIQKCAEYPEPLYIPFVELEKAFDSLETSAAIQALRNQGVNEHYVKILQDIYNESTNTVILHKQSRKMPIRKSVRRGQTIFPKLFTACLQEVVRTFDLEQVGVRVNGEYFINLRFADDVALLSNSGNELQRMLTALEKLGRYVGLKIFTLITKFMINNIGTAQKFEVGGEKAISEYIST